MRLLQTLSPFAILATLSSAHMQLSNPYPIDSPLNPEVSYNDKDYSYTSPLLADGSNFPCKGYHTQTPILYTAEYTAGESYNITLVGSATHGGGSCQISLSYDNGATFRVIKSMMGGCPLTSSYDFIVPSYAPAGPALLAWTWYNKIGNRELYMNCAWVTVASSTTTSKLRRVNRIDRRSTFESLPYLFIADVEQADGVTSIEGDEITFPNPGNDIVYGGAITSSSPLGEGYSGDLTGTNGAAGSSTGSAASTTAAQTTSFAATTSSRASSSTTMSAAATSSVAVTSSSTAATAAASTFSTSTTSSVLSSSASAAAASMSTTYGNWNFTVIVSSTIASTSSTDTPATSAAPTTTDIPSPSAAASSSVTEAASSTTISAFSTSSAAALPSTTTTDTSAATTSSTPIISSSSTTISSAAAATSTTSTTISCTPGTLVCPSSSTFALCLSSGEPSVAQSVAAGTQCSNGQIVMASTDGECTAAAGTWLCSADGTSFSACSEGYWVNMGSVAAGTKCVDGAIVAS